MEYKKLCWQDVKASVSKFNYDFYCEVEKLSPGEDYPLYLFSYDYGDLIGDEKGIFIPSSESASSIHLGGPGTPPELYADLGYGASTSPLGLTYKRSFEWFYQTQKGDIYPAYLDSPGTLFNCGHVFSQNNQRNVYLPNGVLSMTAGARSAFLLAKIGDNLKHKKLQSIFQFNCPSPKHYKEHFKIFKAISDSQKYLDNAWKAEIIFFSKEWVESIKFDSAWSGVKNYFIRLRENRSAYDSYNFLYSHIFRTANKLNTYTQNTYLADTCRYLVEIALGERLGYAPAISDSALPLDLLREAYIEGYGLSYTPVLLIPSLFNLSHRVPVYYSLNYPSVDLTPNKAISYQTNAVNLPKVISILRDTYQYQFAKPMSECLGTFLEEISKEVTYRFFHPNAMSDVQSSLEVPMIDSRFPGNSVSSKSAFFQGCIAIT